MAAFSLKRAPRPVRVAFVLLIAGLMLTTVVLSLGSRLHLSDSLVGALSGMGLGLEGLGLLLVLRARAKRPVR